MAGGLSAAATQIESLVSATQKLGSNGTLTETRKGYDALNRVITEVYKNGQLLSRSLTEEGAFAKDVARANRLYEEQISYLKRIYELKTRRLATEDGSSAAADLDSQIADAGRLIDANNQLIAQVDRQVIARSKLIDLSSDEAVLSQRYVSAQIAQQEKLNEAKAAETSGIRELQQVQEALKQLTQAQRNYIAAVKNKDVASQDYWKQSAQSAMGEIRAIEQKLGSLTMEEDTRRRL